MTWRCSVTRRSTMACQARLATRSRAARRWRARSSGASARATAPAMKAGLVAGLGQPALHPVLDQLLGGRIPVGHHRQAAGQGFGHHVAVGLGEAGEQEEVAAGVVLGQESPRPGATEHGRRLTGLQGLLGRAAAHQDEPRPGLMRPDRLEGLLQQGQVLLGGDTPHVHHRQVIGCQAPAATQGGAAPGRIEQRGIHAPGHHIHPGNALLRQLAAQGPGGHQGEVGPVMEFAQIGGDGALQPAHPIVAAVTVEIGVEFADHRQAQLARRRQCRPAQGAFGHHLDHVRALRGPAPQQHLAGRQAELQVGVAGQRNAAGEHLLHPLSPVRQLDGAPLVGLAGADQVHPVPGGHQAVHHAAGGHRHPVDFRRIGLRHHGHPEVGQWMGDFLANESGAVHARSVAAACCTDVTRR
jgi:hypothetical protein